MIVLFEDKQDDLLSKLFRQSYQDTSYFIYANGAGNLPKIAEELLLKTSDYIVCYIDTIPEMTKLEFMNFYDNTVRILGNRFTSDYPDFIFCDNASAVYEEYLNQKTMLRILYDKENKPKKTYLDRHKVCACMVVVIIKVRLLTSGIKTDASYELSNASKINEQLAFMSVWELFKGFLILRGEERDKNYTLPETFHNASFLDTITRSLFLSNQLNALSTPLIANIFYLLEKYCNAVET